MNAYRQQQLRAAALIEQGATAEQIAAVFGWTKSRAAPERNETGDKRTLTAPTKCGIIKMIRRHVRRWKKQQEGKNMKKIKVWAFTANGIGWNGPVTMYFDSREHAEAARAKYDYKDPVQYVGQFSADKFAPAKPHYFDETVNAGQLAPTEKF